MEFKDRLKQARQDAGLTQTQLAEAAQVTQAMIQSLESGRVKSTTYLLAIAKVLKKDPSWLQYGDFKRATDIDLANIPGLRQLEYTELPILDDNDIIELAQSGRLKDNYERKLIIMDSRIKLTKDQFAYDVINDSMVDPTNPDRSIFNGESAIIDMSIKEEPGDVVLALIQPNNVKLRQLNQDGADFWLDAFNPRYPRLPINRSEVSIIGTLVGAQTKIRIFKQKPIDNSPQGMVGGGGDGISHPLK